LNLTPCEPLGTLITFCYQGAQRITEPIENNTDVLISRLISQRVAGAKESWKVTMRGDFLVLAVRRSMNDLHGRGPHAWKDNSMSARDFPGLDEVGRRAEFRQSKFAARRSYRAKQGYATLVPFIGSKSESSARLTGALISISC